MEREDYDDNDTALVRKARRGCEVSFRSLFDQYYSAIHGYAYKICHDSSVADDIAQQTFIKVANKLSSYEEKNKFSAWLYRIALNTARDHLRALKRYQQRLDAQTPEPMISQPGISLGVISEWLDKLPDLIRETFMLVHAIGYTQKEAAKSMNCPVGTVAWRITKAREIFEQLQDQ